VIVAGPKGAAHVTAKDLVAAVENAFVALVRPGVNDTRKASHL